uniref:THAP domain-containing protein 5 n=2 Tax=Lygus hesperus TaxID=30085 RepID=A0A146LLE7_LYGHE
MGGTRCAVATCNNTYKKAKKEGHLLSLHSFPRDSELRDCWVAACRRADDWNPLTSHVCSDHFTPNDFEADQRLQLWTGIKWKPKLKHGAIPSVQLPREGESLTNDYASKKLVSLQDVVEHVDSPEINGNSSRLSPTLDRMSSSNLATCEGKVQPSLSKKQSKCVRKSKVKKIDKIIVESEKNVIYSCKDFELYVNNR